MSGFFSEETIYRVKQSADIVDVISRYLPLKKMGRYFKTNCPFHGEENPSFTVNPDRQIFHCFGCQEGGDVFAFLMKYQNLNFGEAVQELAELYNISLPSASNPAADQTNDNKKLRDKLFRINEIAARYFYDMLNSPQGEPARKYLENRTIGQEIMHEFSLGYAPVGWRNLLAYMDKRNIPLDVVEKAGADLFRKKMDTTIDSVDE